MKNSWIIFGLLMLAGLASAYPVPPEDCHYGLDPCSADYCTAACPCDGQMNYLPEPPTCGTNCRVGYGAGNCVDNTSCVNSFCVIGVGANYSCPAYTNICVFTAEAESSSSSSSTSSSSSQASQTSSSQVSSSVSSSSSSSIITSSSSSSSSIVISSSSSSSSIATSSSSSSSFLVSTSSSVVSSSSSSSSSMILGTSSSPLSSSSSSSSIISSSVSSSSILVSSSVSSSSKASSSSMSSSSSTSMASYQSSTSSSVSSSSAKSSSSESSSSSTVYASMSSSSSEASSSSQSSSSSQASLPSSVSIASSSSSSSSSSTLAGPKYFGQTYPYSCSREYGLLSNFITPLGYTEINLTNMSKYVLPNVRNVYVASSTPNMVLTTFFRGNYTILVGSYNTGPISPANFDLYVLITGWDKAYAYNLTAPQAGATYVSLNSTNFLSYEDTYEINFKNEITDENWTYGNLLNQTLFVKCADYSQVILDLKYLNNITGKSWIYLATREAPSLQVMATDTSGNTHQREQKMDAGNNVLDFYLIPIPFNKNVYSFGLIDYTGQYASAEFQAKTHISYNYPQIFSRDFDDARYVQNFECIPNHDYNIIVCSNSVSGLCTSLGKITCLNNETKTLIINTPSLGNADYNFNDLTTAWTSTNTNVGVTYSGQSGVVKNVIFNVFNTTGNYTLIYTNNLVTSSGTFTYALPNLNGTYYVEAIYNTSTHGLLHSGKSWSLGNLTWSNAFNMTNLGATYMGVSRVALLSVASMILVVTILLIAGKATSMGIGIISASLSWGALYGFGWIPHAIPFWIFFIFLFIGVAVKWSEGRAEVIS